MRAAAVLLLALLAGCAHTPSKSVIPKPISAPTYAEGYADGRRAYHEDLRNDPGISIGYYAAGPCDKKHAWLPKDQPNIPRIQYLRALRHEEKLHNRCAARHNALRKQAKAVLGAIRGGE